MGENKAKENVIGTEDEAGEEDIRADVSEEERLPHKKCVGVH